MADEIVRIEQAAAAARALLVAEAERARTDLAEAALAARLTVRDDAGIRRHDLVDLEGEIKGLVDAVDKRDDRWRKVLVGFAALIAVTAAAAGAALWGGVQAQNAYDARDEDLLARRVESCERDNTVRQGQRTQAETSATSARTFRDLLLQGQRITPEVQVRIDAFNAGVVGPFLALADQDTGPFKPRDCSVGALERPAHGV